MTAAYWIHDYGSREVEDLDRPPVPADDAQPGEWALVVADGPELESAHRNIDGRWVELEDVQVRADLLTQLAGNIPGPLPARWTTARNGLAAALRAVAGAGLNGAERAMVDRAIIFLADVMSAGP